MNSMANLARKRYARRCSKLLASTVRAKPSGRDRLTIAAVRGQFHAPMQQAEKDSRKHAAGGDPAYSHLGRVMRLVAVNVGATAPSGTIQASAPSPTGASPPPG